jgi:DNA-binding NtrC family response regulator
MKQGIAHNTTHKGILIVDDEYLIRNSLSMMLRGDDREVKTASTGRDALKEISNHHYDICFLDVHLPDMNGLDIMKIMKKVSQATNIIIMTGSEITYAMMISIRENARLFMAKPFEMGQVKAIVDKLLAQGEPLNWHESKAPMVCAASTS